MEYINYGGENSSVQSVPEDTPQTTNKHTMYLQEQRSVDNQQSKGSDHHLWEPYTNVVLFAFNHQNEWILTF